MHNDDSNTTFVAMSSSTRGNYSKKCPNDNGTIHVVGSGISSYCRCCLASILRKTTSRPTTRNGHHRKCDRRRSGCQKCAFLPILCWILTMVAITVPSLRQLQFAKMMQLQQQEFSSSTQQYLAGLVMDRMKNEKDKHANNIAIAMPTRRSNTVATNAGEMYHELSSNGTDNVTIPSSSSIYGRLRRDWNHHGITLSPLAKRIQQHQHNCSLPVAIDYMDNNYGMGSHLYVWSQALCNAMEMQMKEQEQETTTSDNDDTSLAKSDGWLRGGGTYGGYRLRSYNPTWLWMDQARCDADMARTSPLLCYFPAVEVCNTTTTMLRIPPNVTNPRSVRHRCSYVKQSTFHLQEFRAASMEFLFSSISPLVIEEAQRQIGLLFSKYHHSIISNDYDAAHDLGTANTISSDIVAPSDMITVHMRWGDKFWEMDLPSEHEYVAAVCKILHERIQENPQGTNDSHEENEFLQKEMFDCNRTNVNVYLASEDPRAVQAFQNAAPKGWMIYIDRTITELDQFRPKKGNRASWTTRNTNGRAGLVALGSLLVALEANDYVLTTQSNWSRLMDALRRNVIDPRCNGCTRSVDLRPGEW